MVTITFEQLRSDSAVVLACLQKNQTCILTYDQRAVAEIKPLLATDLDLEAASSVDIGEDFLTQSELAYYLALK
jgi:hypothetical protein